MAALLVERRCDVLLNATDPRFVMPLFRAALDARARTTWTWRCRCRARTPRTRTPERRQAGRRAVRRWPAVGAAGKLALVGIGVEPGLSDVFARYAADTLFREIDEIGVRDGANLAVDGYDFAPTFSIWTTIEECLNPPVVWERDRGWYTTEPFCEPETFTFPAGIGPVECVNVEHEEVLLIPRWVEARRVTFKYGLGEEFIGVLGTLHKLGLDSPPGAGRRREVSPRDVVAACLPDPATLGDRMRGRTCAGTWVTGTGTDGAPREVYLYHVVDNAGHGRVRVAGGRVADRGQPGGGAGADRRRAPGPAPACSGPRRWTRGRSWTCSPTTARRGRARNGSPGFEDYTLVKYVMSSLGARPAPHHPGAIVRPCGTQS